MASQDEQIQHFIAVTGVDEQRAKFFLESAAWNLEMATASFFEDGDVEAMEPIDDGDTVEEMPTPPVPMESQAEVKGKRSKPASNSRFATIANFQSDEAESSSEEEGQAYYAGGSDRSGQQVIGPSKKKKDKNVVENLFKSAKDHGAEVVDPNEGRQPTSTQAFHGTGYTLGQTDDDHGVVQGRSLRTRPKQVDVVLRLWKNGFSIDDGPLRDFKDPSNKDFLQSVSSGEVPQELISMAKGGEVNLNMEDHRNEDYVKPKVPVRAFTGTGHTLGSPAPNVVSNNPSTSSGSHSGTNSKPVSVTIDNSQPTTNIQIRLADGSRLVSKFNHSHKVSDIRGYIISNRPQDAGANFVLMTTFPNKELSDEAQTLAEANLINAVIVQRMK